ncbi:hypothetical protein EV122DRAFT_226035 [Schizophyllum commune]
MLANTSQTDPTRRALNIDTACNLAMLHNPPLASQAPDSCHAPSQPPLSHGTRVTDAHDRSDSPPPPPTRPRGPMPLVYRPKSSDFLPTLQHGGDGLRPTNASGAPSTASGVRSTSGDIRSTSSDIRSPNSGGPSTTSRVRWKIPTPLDAESSFITASECTKSPMVVGGTGVRFSRGLKRASGRGNR